jgi:multicomponent Na+:H+ antiporter subunit D|tara:strand:- start:8382 stop:9857 length:1476 start_codon:yes stop_codon:yes gene_type:complete
MSDSDTMLILTLLVPLAAAVAIPLVGRYPNVREGVTLVAAALLLYLVTGVYTAAQTGADIVAQLPEMLPGIRVAFSVEPLGMLFSLVGSFLWLVTSVYSIGYMRAHDEQHQTRFYTCFAIAIAAVMGVAYADNLFTLFVFYEVLTLSTYPLVTHAGTDEARHGGRVYLGILLTTSILFFLLAIIGTWSIAGTLDFREGGVFSPGISSLLSGALLLLFAFGIGKAALMPFHRWLPAAMVAPTPVSALLHAVAVVKAGVFTMLKVCVYTFGLDLLGKLTATQILLYVAAATVLLASLVALRQDNLKARLAYSTVSQLSYVTIGALLASSIGVTGSAMHIAMHAFGKITLFFCAGAFIVAAHKTEVSQMRGLGRQMPITMIAFFIGSLSIIGLPPAGGTWSKWYLMLGALQAEQMILVVTLMASSLLNIAYLLPIPIRGFFPGDDRQDATGIKEAPWPVLIALCVTATGCLALFFYPQPLYEIALAIAQSPGGG